MAVTVNINGNIQIGDTTTNSAPLQFPLTGLSMSGIALDKTNSLTVGTSPVSVAIPNTTANFLYIQNLHATYTLTVTWTPAGGSSNVVLTLPPASALMFLMSTTGGGITALSLQASGAGVPVNVILVG